MSLGHAKIAPVDAYSPEDGYAASILDKYVRRGPPYRSKYNSNAWGVIEYDPVILPVTPLPIDLIDALHPQPRDPETESSHYDINTLLGGYALRQELDTLLALLSDREQRILRARVGYDKTGEPKTVKVVAEAEGSTHNNVFYTERDAKYILRTSRQAKALLGFLDVNLWEEPTRGQMLAYRAYLKNGGDVKHVGAPEASGSQRQYDKMSYIEDNKRLMKQRDDYYATLSNVFSDRPGYYEINDVHELIDKVAKEFEGYSPNNYAAHKKIVELLSYHCERHELLEAVGVIRDASKRNFYYREPEKRDVLIQKSKQHVKQIVARLVLVQKPAFKK